MGERSAPAQRGKNAAGAGCPGWGLTSPKLMRLACFRISVSPSRSFILRYLGMGARGQRGLSPIPSLPSPAGPRGPPAAASLLALPVQGRRQRLHLLHGRRLLPLVELPLDLVFQLVAHLERAQGSCQGPGGRPFSGPASSLHHTHNCLLNRGAGSPSNETASPRPAPPPQPSVPVIWEPRLCFLCHQPHPSERPQMPPLSSTSAAAELSAGPAQPTARLGPVHWPLPRCSRRLVSRYTLHLRLFREAPGP